MTKKIDIRLTDVTGYTKKFETLREFRNFMKREEAFWKKRYDAFSDDGARRAHSHMRYHSNFQAAISHIDSWDRKDLLKWNDEVLQQSVLQVHGQHLHGASSGWLYSGHPFTPVYVDCHNHEHGHKVAEAFIKFMTTPHVGNLSDAAAFLGTMRAYEFLHQDSDLVKRRVAERRSLARLRSRLDESYSELFTEVEAFKGDFKKWDDGIRKEWMECSEIAVNDHAELLDSHKTDFDTRLEAWQKQIGDLEKMYEEKLRLSMPAKYWKDASSRFRTQGYFAISALILTVLIGVWFFADLYSKWLGGEGVPLGFGSIQGVVLLGTIIAAFAYLVRTFGRITFSCFHLMRDAEERRQLTYLYLSLSRKDRIDESSRDIVLQALFSRSESGLLGMDSSPTLPNAIDLVKESSRGGPKA